MSNDIDSEADEKRWVVSTEAKGEYRTRVFVVKMGGMTLEAAAAFSPLYTIDEGIANELRRMAQEGAVVFSSIGLRAIPASDYTVLADGFSFVLDVTRIWEVNKGIRRIWSASTEDKWQTKGEGTL